MRCLETYVMFESLLIGSMYNVNTPLSSSTCRLSCGSRPKYKLGFPEKTCSSLFSWQYIIQKEDSCIWNRYYVFITNDKCCSVSLFKFRLDKFPCKSCVISRINRPPVPINCRSCINIFIKDA